MLNLKTVTLALGITAAISFAICVLWGLLLPEALHMHQFLELLLPGFTWLSVGSAVLGLFESFLFGAYAGVVYVPVYNFLSRRLAQ